MSRTSLLLVAFAVLAVPACHTSRSDHAPGPGVVSSPVPSSDVVRVNGTVRHLGMEGGFWAVQGDNGTTYDPMGGVPLEFQKDGLRVYIEAKVRSDQAGIHQAGPIVEIITIRRL